MSKMSSQTRLLDKKFVFEDVFFREGQNFLAVVQGEIEQKKSKKVSGGQAVSQGHSQGTKQVRGHLFFASWLRLFATVYYPSTSRDVLCKVRVHQDGNFFRPGLADRIEGVATLVSSFSMNGTKNAFLTEYL